jgi:ABC-2 type transport system permease protein
MFLGGVYYPTTVIPSWLGQLSNLMPLTYGLRALRRVLASDPPIGAIASDIGMLVVLTMVLLVASLATLRLALRRARTDGALAHY